MERFSKRHPGLLQRVRSTRNQVSTELHRHKDSFKDRKPGWSEGRVSEGECESAAGQTGQGHRRANIWGRGGGNAKNRWTLSWQEIKNKKGRKAKPAV